VFLELLHTVDARASMCPGLAADFYRHELLCICKDTMV
jgi:hypothetical protein